LGYYKLTRAKARANDWVWIVDHSLQLGAEKCLVILGLRLSDLPDGGRSVSHADVEAIEVLPVTKSTGDIVWQQLEDAVEKTGVPREIVSDHGSDLRAGIRRFCEAHPECSPIYDITHKAANVLKHRLDPDEEWQRFTTLAAQSKSQIQQTALAYLRAPKQQSKARYMNVKPLVTWGWKLLRRLEQPTWPAWATEDGQHREDKLGWIREFRAPLEHWHALMQVIETTEQVVREEGFQHTTPAVLQHRLEEEMGSPSERVQAVRDELVRFVEEESAKAKPDERLLGSSEVIESVFGKLKRIERDQATSGFTGLILSVAAMVSTTTAEVIQQAMERVSTKMVLTWCRNMFGKSIQAKRKEAFADPVTVGTKMGSA
jgi:hypothetical protein